MFSKSARAIAGAIRELFRNWPALAIMTATYGVLLTGVYLFVTTKEATPIQLIITIVLALLTPTLFFVLQTISAGYATGIKARTLIAQSMKNSWKLFVVSLPVIAITALGVYLLARTQTYLSLNTSSNAADPLAITPLSLQPSTHWVGVAISSLRYLLIGVFAPLALIHLWIAANHTGLLETLKRSLMHMTRAFAARSVLIYLAGFLVFALVPYLVLFKTTTTSGAWLEIGLLVTRLAVVFCLTLLGWVVTVGALALTEQSNHHESV